jgi:hypothetical protein
MPTPDLDRLRELRERFDRQTAAWDDLRKRFASLPQESIVVADDLLDRLVAPASAAASLPQAAPAVQAGVRG